MSQNENLYRRYAALQSTLVRTTLPVECELVSQALRDFRLGGVTLPPPERQRFREIMQTLAARQASFEQNLMDATDAFSHHERDSGALAGLPGVVLERARATALERDLPGWLLLLDAAHPRARHPWRVDGFEGAGRSRLLCRLLVE